ncbi:hypothetical protein [Roseivirga misakiensis]|uniref:DUF4252 domain-containing protein n=1 Tax=Roseivirga misakiensis TaxID=1563681 RepID=A0A1E5SLE2_9BACT|nr:hypothetical protein [Roseivirga misakiensis]OEJ99939.1 hypothetical protein BFP71_10360 [Roseivirga misakiensis]
MRYLFIVIFLSLGFTSQLSAQHVYPIKFDDCYLDQFKFETDLIRVKVDQKELIDKITAGWTSKMINKAVGDLGLQILVDKRGNSCLVSVRNDTNMNLKKMNLSKNINSKLKWTGTGDKISALVLLQFKDGTITTKRLGTVDMKNLTEIINN